MIREQTTDKPLLKEAIPVVEEERDGAEQLMRRIKNAIRRDTGSRIHNLSVLVTGTHVVLEGFCSTFHSFQLAQNAAMHVAEDLDIDNQIEVL
jgi:osmotically-inducible protein OsmY